MSTRHPLLANFGNPTLRKLRKRLEPVNNGNPSWFPRGQNGKKQDVITSRDEFGKCTVKISQVSASTEISGVLKTGKKIYNQVVSQTPRAWSVLQFQHLDSHIMIFHGFYDCWIIVWNVKTSVVTITFHVYRNFCNISFSPIPYAPCIEYLSTFALKITQM